MRALTLVLVGLGLALLSGFAHRQAAQRAPLRAGQAQPSGRPAGVAAALPPEPKRYVFVDTLPVAGDQAVFALRGVDPQAKAIGVVLHGWCGHGLGVLQAFAYAAADAGQFLALQGDHPCGSGPLRGWSNDTDALDRRIDVALRAYLGSEPPAEVMLMGASQGVERAIAALHHRHREQKGCR